MPAAISIPIGTPFGRLLTISSTYAGLETKRGRYVDVMCTCPSQTILRMMPVKDLRSGNTRSCGCLHEEQAAKNINAYNKLGLPNPFAGKFGAAHPGFKGENSLIRQRKEWLINEKSNPCVDCEVQKPVHVMQFDHVPERDIGVHILINTATIGRHSLNRLKEERAKCDLVCANCHADRTYKRHHISIEEPMLTYDADL